jgi:hypothetical protein
MELILGLVGMVALVVVPVAYATAQIRCLRRWRGGWRLAAGVPVVGWAGWTAMFLRDIAADPTSHNLFPFEIAIGVVIAEPYLGALLLLCRFRGTPR